MGVETATCNNSQGQLQSSRSSLQHFSTADPSECVCALERGYGRGCDCRPNPQNLTFDKLPNRSTLASTPASLMQRLPTLLEASRVQNCNCPVSRLGNDCQTPPLSSRQRLLRCHPGADCELASRVARVCSPLQQRWRIPSRNF